MFYVLLETSTWQMLRLSLEDSAIPHKNHTDTTVKMLELFLILSNLLILASTLFTFWTPLLQGEAHIKKS